MLWFNLINVSELLFESIFIVYHKLYIFNATLLISVSYASRLEDLILEAITSLKEPAGSNKTALATYIEVYTHPLLESNFSSALLITFIDFYCCLPDYHTRYLTMMLLYCIVIERSLYLTNLFLFFLSSFFFCSA